MRVLALSAVCLVLLAGCGGDSDAPIELNELAGVVLLPADLGPRFTQFDEGPIRSADELPGPRADSARFGRLGGRIARYRRAGSTATRGPLVVESRAEVFGDASGAEDDLEAARASAQGVVDDTPDLGDGAVLTRLGGGGASAATYYTLVWRYRNATATLTVNGFEGSLDIDDVEGLARKQQTRLEDAAG